jgi:two-component system chemotaxis response regulator CheY
MNLSKLRVLVVDDMASMRLMIKAILRDQGIEDITEASDGERAIEWLGTKGFDLVICDWDMPKQTGLDVLRHVRATAKLKALPFVMLTANSARGHVSQAIDAGVSDYLAKPFKPQALVQKVIRVVGTDRKPSTSE